MFRIEITVWTEYCGEVRKSAVRFDAGGDQNFHYAGQLLEDEWQPDRMGKRGPLFVPGFFSSIACRQIL